MDQSKPFYYSVTFWGLVATVAAQITKSVGFTTDADAPDIEKWFVTYGPEIATAIGLAVAWYGRVKAKHQITALPKPPAKEPEPTETGVK